MAKLRFHVSCCGRSGSMYLADAVRAMGFSVLHEMKCTWPFRVANVRELAANEKALANYDGFVGWKWALLTPDLVGPLPVQFHLVRRPDRAIESATTHSDKLLRAVESRLGGPDFPFNSDDERETRLARAVNYWVRYNERFDQGKVLLRIEDFRPGGASLLAFCAETGSPVEATAALSHMPRSVNARPKSKRRVATTWAGLQRLFPSACQRIERLADRYGYDMREAEELAPTG